jgi:hypothetical protein
MTEQRPVGADHYAEDPRFTFGLLIDVAEVLVVHGYPQLTGTDLVDLGQALFRYLYAEPTRQSSPGSTRQRQLDQPHAADGPARVAFVGAPVRALKRAASTPHLHRGKLVLLSLWNEGWQPRHARDDSAGSWDGSLSTVPGGHECYRRFHRNRDPFGMDETLLDRITVDPAVCGGRPCIRGHRIWVSLVLFVGMLAMERPWRASLPSTRTSYPTTCERAWRTARLKRPRDAALGRRSATPGRFDCGVASQGRGARVPSQRARHRLTPEEQRRVWERAAAAARATEQSTPAQATTRGWWWWTARRRLTSSPQPHGSSKAGPRGAGRSRLSC